MKISEMTNDQAVDALIRLTVPVSNICDDSELDNLLEAYKTLKEESIFKTIGQLMPKLVSYAIKNHKEDFYEIISVLIDKPVAAVANMKLTETIKIIRESYDEVLASFFTSFMKQGKNTEG